MKLSRESYVVSRATLEKVLSALGDNWFSTATDDDGYSESYNNDDVIEADKLLQGELQAQEPNKGICVKTHSKESS